ncbi:MAG: nicotinate (nicotinamide) nucleotide adenylyltransferase [Coprobacillaceae bacterium]
MSNSKKENIIVFGGTFNPPTLAHLHLATIAKEFVKAKKCIFLPVGDDYNKKDIISASHRLNMLEALILNEEGFDIERFETKQKTFTTTYESLSYIKNKYGTDTNYYFMMGSDNLEKISDWKNIHNLLEEFHLLIIKRADMNSDNIIKKDAFFKRYKSKIMTINIDNDVIEHISSSLVREMSILEETRMFLKPSVFEYIKEHKLYDFKDYDAV